MVTPEEIAESLRAMTAIAKTLPVSPHCSAREMAEGLLRASEQSLRRAHYVALELIHFVAVGEIAMVDWDCTELPPWAVRPEPTNRLVPSDFAREVAAEPCTHAAAMSPGMRRELLRALDEVGSPLAGLFFADEDGRFPRELAKRRGFTEHGEMVWLNPLGLAVAEVLRRAK